MDERKLIETVLSPLAAGAAGAFALSDDAALLPVSNTSDHIITLDTLVQGVHFRPGDPAGLIGKKALRVNISDLTAKGATPFAWFLSLGLPVETPDTWIAEFVAGLAEDQARFGLDLYGGDTVRCPHGIVISVTMVGVCAKNTSVRRTGARPGDVIYVSGTLGDGALGLLAGSDTGLAGCNAADRAWLNGRYLLPDPPAALASGIAAHASAAMDISDGLVSDLGLLCAASGVGADIDVDAVPLSAPARRVVDCEPRRLNDILSGGDDYQVLAAIGKDQSADFENAAKSAKIVVTRIGRILANSRGLSFYSAGEVISDLQKTSFSHFK